MIEKTFVETVFNPLDEPVHNVLLFPGSTVITGWGKTMAARWLCLYTQKKRRELIATEETFNPIAAFYTDFEYLLSRLPAVTLVDHTGGILRAVALSCLPALIENESGFLALADDERAAWWSFLNAFLPSSPILRRQIPDIQESLLQDRTHYSNQDYPFGLHDELHTVIAQIRDWLFSIGITSIYLIVDNISGYPQTKLNQMSANLVRPILMTDNLFHLNGVFWKIFLSEETADKLWPPPLPENLRFKIFNIKWDKDSLKSMTSNYLQYASDGNGGQFGSVVGIDVTSEFDIDTELANLALAGPGNPATNIQKLTNKLLGINDGIDQITRGKWKSFLAQAKKDYEVKKVMNNQNIRKYYQQQYDDLVAGLLIDAELLGKYRKKVILNDDPKTIMHDEHEIKVIRGRMDRSEIELKNLAQQLGESELENANSKADQINSRLNDLEKRVNEVENLKILNSYTPKEEFPRDQREWFISVLLKLQEKEYEEVRDVLAALKNNQIETSDAKELVDIFEKNWPEKITDGIDKDLADQAQQIFTKADVTFDTKVKILVPLIPLFANWETEFGIGLGVNLKTLWERIVRKVRKTE